MSRVRWARVSVLILPGDRVEIHDADQGLIAALEVDPVLNRPEPVADMQLAGGLNS